MAGVPCSESVAGRVRAWLDEHGYPDADSEIAAARIIAADLDEPLSTVRSALRRCGATRHNLHQASADLPQASADLPQAGTSSAQQKSSAHQTDEPEPLAIEQDGAPADAYRIDREAGVYHCQIEGRYLAVPLDAMQDLVACYAHEGAGLTQAQLCRRAWVEHGLEITRGRMRRLLRLLSVDKNSIPLAPHLLEDLEPDEAELLIREQKEALIELKLRARDPKYWRAQYEKSQRTRLDVGRTIDEALAALPARPVVPVAPGERLAARRGEPATWLAVLSDWHVGHCTDQVEAMVKRLVTRWHERADPRPVERLVVAVTGDILDGAGGEMFPGQHLEQDVHGYDQVCRAADLLAWAVGSLATGAPGAAVEVHCVPGNHGRATKSRADDKSYVLEMVTYKLAQRGARIPAWAIYPGGQVVQVDVGDGRLLLTHGCSVRLSTQRHLRDLVHAHPCPRARWTCAVSGHLHEALVILDAHLSSVRSGALKLHDQHGKLLGYLARPAQLFVELDPALGPVDFRIQPLDDFPLSHATHIGAPPWPTC